MNYNDPNFEFAKKQANSLAIVGFIMALFIPIVGIFLCVRANRMLKDIGESKHVLASIGTALSAIQIIGTIFMVVLFAILMFSGINEITIGENPKEDKCSKAICQNDCIGPNCTCTYTDEDGNTYEIHCD